MTYTRIIIWWLFFLFNGFIISGDSNLRNCKRVWGMSNTINNIPMYSTGLYMCVETPDGSVLALPDIINPPEQIKTIVKTVKNLTNSSNHTKFLSNFSTSNFFNQTNKTFHLQNYTNYTEVLKNNSTNVSIFNLAPSPSSSTTTIATPSTTSATTPSTAITTTPSPVIITTPSSNIMTTPSSTYKTTTPNPIPAPSPKHDIDNIDNNFPPLVLNETNKNYKEDLNEIEKEPMNPLLPTVIILSSIVGACILSGIGFYIYKNGCCRGKKCSKTLPEAQAEKVQDLESGEKNENKNRNSWTVMTTTLKTRKKLKELQGYRNKKVLKPKLKSPTKTQKEKQAAVKVQKYPNKPPGMGGIRHIDTKRRDNNLIRSHMEEQASRIPGGMRNASLQRMLKRFPKSPRQQKIDSMNLNMTPHQQEWYKEQFSDELVSTVDKIPYTPPALPAGDPPPPPDLARKQLKDIKRVVYGNKQNDNSPKMTIRELNPEEN
tara:strand:+ start:1177 stop:2637 length:1461 start_codon:yes stop_codon:yes gene_type:complete